jgi:hypothetical protein
MDISESARKLFLGVLGACLYCWLAKEVIAKI